MTPRTTQRGEDARKSGQSGEDKHVSTNQDENEAEAHWRERDAAVELWERRHGPRTTQRAEQRDDFDLFENGLQQVLGTLTWLEGLDERSNLQSDIIMLRDVLLPRLPALRRTIEQQQAELWKVTTAAAEELGDAQARIEELESVLRLIASSEPPRTMWTHAEARDWRAQEFVSRRELAVKALNQNPPNPRSAAH